jgi:hypothetical protein
LQPKIVSPLAEEDIKFLKSNMIALQKFKDIFLKLLYKRGVFSVIQGRTSK